MYLNNYSVRIPDGNEVQGGYVEVDHGQKYRLVLRNDTRERCDARVEVDGKHAGTWRINAKSTITLERPANDDGYFTAYITGTQEAKSANVDYSNPDLGLVRVTFTPEKRTQEVNWIYTSTVTWNPEKRGVTNTSDYPIAQAACFSCDQGPPSGSKPVGTGLSSHSAQKFSTVGQINLDYNRSVTINLRLVGKSDGPRPLVDASSNPIPPRVW